MIVTSEVVARLEVDDAQIARGGDGALGSIRDRLVKRVIAEGENIGAMIRKQSVRVRRSDAKASSSMRTVYVGTWHPRPRDGVYFVGGPLDGSMEPIDADEPLELLRAPIYEAPERVDTTSTSPSPLTAVDGYRLAGKDSERDCWVYEYIS